MKLKRLACIVAALAVLGIGITFAMPSESNIQIAGQKSKRLEIRREKESLERRAKRQQSKFAKRSVGSVEVIQMLLLTKKEKITTN